MSCIVTEAKELSSNVISNHTHSMKTNWYGIVKALLGDWFPGQGGGLLGKIKKKGGADDKNVPFCLTEEFAAVYRLHPLMPPGLVIEGEGSDSTSFVNLEDCLTAKGRELMRKPGMSKKVFNSVFHYPCGALVGANYPDAMRNISPTDMRGVDIPGEGFKIDLAAIDLYRDRERGIQNYNNFRRMLKLKPFKSWERMTGNPEDAKKLEKIYGPAPEGIEKCDLLVGDLYEKKLPGFAISETSFVVFLLMATRRLDSDPYLNELFDDEHYTPIGIKHVNETDTLKDILQRHYPELADAFPKGQSAFKPIYKPEKWAEGIPDELVETWEKTKKANDEYFNEKQSYGTFGYKTE